MNFYIFISKRIVNYFTTGDDLEMRYNIDNLAIKLYES